MNGLGKKTILEKRVLAAIFELAAIQKDIYAKVHNYNFTLLHLDTIL